MAGRVASTSTPLETRESRGLALLAVAFTVLTWGVSNVVVKVASTNGLVTSFYRLWLAVPLLWALAAGMPSIRRRFGRAWLWASAGGGLLFALHQLLFFTALKATRVADVTIIGALQPALVLLVAGRMFGERATLRAVLWSLLAFAGTALVVVGSAGMPSWSPLGDALAVVNLFVFTGYFLFSKHIRRDVGASEYVIGMTTVAALVILVVCLATGQELGVPRALDWAIILFIAVLPGTIGHVLTNWAHRHTSAFVMSMMLLAVPVLAAGGAAVFLDEALGAAQVVGGAVVLLSIAMVIRSTRAAAAEELAESLAGTDAP
jgi:drug/metabolite transporter (DMT)-like permease